MELREESIGIHPPVRANHDGTSTTPDSADTGQGMEEPSEALAGGLVRADQARGGGREGGRGRGPVDLYRRITCAVMIFNAYEVDRRFVSLTESRKSHDISNLDRRTTKLYPYALRYSCIWDLHLTLS
jgi:hypothetical protein